MENELEEQFKKSVNEIKTDEYTMSIGELMNMYKDGDLTISPEYQRCFRWTKRQRSAFIESLILGIPIPSIFVAQNSDGKWDVIDGLQRISSILQFMGELKGKEPLKTDATKFLPALKNKDWDSIGAKFRRIIKRRRISVVIIDASSNNDIKYELFQRLNANGSKLTDQEIRNVLVLMANKDLFNAINELSKDDTFLHIINNLSNKRIEKQADKEFLSEVFILMTVSAEDINTSIDLGPFITNALIDNEKLNSKIKVEKVKEKIVSVFNLIYEILGENASKIFNPKKERYEHRFSRPIFELTYMYTWKNLKAIRKNPDILKKYHENISSTKLFNEINKRGYRPTKRIQRVIMTNGDSDVTSD